MTGDPQPTQPTKPLLERLEVDFALQAAGVGIWEVDPLTNQVSWDERCRQLFGLAKHNPLSYEQAVRYIHPDDLNRVNQALQRAMMPGEDARFDQTYRTIGADDGQLRWVRFQGQSTFSPTGQLLRLAGIAQDVTAHVLLAQSQQQGLALFGQAPVGIALLSAPDLVFQLANPFYSQLTGRTPDQLVGRPLLEALPELAGQGFDTLLREVVTTGLPYVNREASAVVYRSGHLETIYFDHAYQPQRDASGRVTQLLVVLIDTTQQVRDRQALQERETTFRNAIETAQLGTWVVDLKTGLTDMSARYLAMFGLRQSQTTLEEGATRLVEGEHDKVWQAFNEATRPGSGGRYQCEYSITHGLTGQRRIIQALGQTFFDEQGQPLRIEGTVQDITLQRDLQLALEAQVHQRTQELALANQALLISQQQLARFIRMAPVPMALLEGADYVFTIANERYLELVGRTEQQLIGKPLLVAMPEAAAYLGTLLPQIRQGTPVYAHEVATTLNKAGQSQTGYYNFTWEPYYQSDGSVNGFVTVAADITEQVLARQRAEESQRQYQVLSGQLATSNGQYATLNEQLEASNSLLTRSNDSLQTFAYIASHDLQEPLRKIQQFGDILKTNLASSASPQDLLYLERMQLAASRMSGLIKDLLSYSRVSTQPSREVPVPLNALLETVNDVLELVISETTAQLQVDPLPTVSGDAIQLGQLFQNLLANALKFRRVDQAGVPIAPAIHIRSQLVEAAQLPPTVKPARKADRYYLIEVADNGIGFEEKHAARIFQVFQRLHGRNEFAGTGIGLAICEKVVTNHGGAITARSQPGQGATFSIYLPA